MFVCKILHPMCHMVHTHSSYILRTYTVLSVVVYITCEEAWEKGPIVSKYCFEKNVLKVLQIFRRHGKGTKLASKYCFEKNAFENFANIYTILVSNKEVTLQCTYYTSKYQESEKSHI